MALKKKKPVLPSLPPLDAPADPKTEFFLAASHQLKSPVAIIQWCLQSVMELPTDARVRNLTEKALTQADAMSLLISDMLHVFRIVNRPTTESLELVHLNVVLDEVLHQVEPAAQRRTIHIMKGPIENLPEILASESYIKQAVINLVDNAIKYSREGGKVTVTAKRDKEGFVEIAVQDEGIGISELEQGRLFTEFFRGEEAKETTRDGTGLGLVLVKHIAEAFGGHIKVESHLHQGSTFTLFLPYTATASKGR